jgi:nifR3 family TIM-barrel protein
VNNQEGSALMRDPALIEKVVHACKENTSRPVTVKMRRGFDEDHINAVECALAAQEGGASAVAVHGRTREQMYSGTADWSTIADVKKALQIPVIGNGDVVDGPSAKRMMDETGCDAVMIARAAQGNPWIFREVNAYLEKGVILERPPRRDIVSMILRHADMLCECKGEKVGMREMRGHVHNYLTGFPGASRVRKSVNSVTTKAQLQALLAKEYPYA